MGIKRKRALQTIRAEGGCCFEDAKNRERVRGEGSNNGVGARVHLWICCVVSMVNENEMVNVNGVVGIKCGEEREKRKRGKRGEVGYFFFTKNHEK